MQIDDLPIPERPSKINDPCLQKVFGWERCLDSMEFVRAPKPEPPVDIKKTHDLWIHELLHIEHKLYPLVFLVLLLLNFS